MALGCSDLGEDPASPNSETGNLAPSEPSNPSPPDDAENISVNSGLTWSCIDPEGDPLSYDLWFGIEKEDEAFVINLTSASFTPPGPLEFDERYRWKIVARDNNGNSVEGDWWDFNTTEDGGGGGGVSWAGDIQPILNNSCTACHGGNGGLFLDSYSSLMSGGVVVPGDADGSILYLRVAGTSAGSQMPQGKSPLARSLIDKIRAWINEGALDN